MLFEQVSYQPYSIITLVFFYGCRQSTQICFRSEQSKPDEDESFISTWIVEPWVRKQPCDFLLANN